MKAKKTVATLSILTLLSMVFIALPYIPTAVAEPATWSSYATDYDTLGYLNCTMLAMGMPAGVLPLAYPIVIGNATARADADDGIVNCDDIRFAMANYTLLAGLFPTWDLAYAAIANAESDCGWPPKVSSYSWLYVDDYKFTYGSPTVLPGYLFNVTVNLYNVGNASAHVGLGAIDWTLKYNTTFLDALTTYLGGGTNASKTELCLSDFVGLVSPYSPTAPINDTAGKVRWAAVVKDIYNPCDCEGSTWTLLTITFNVTAAPPYCVAPPPALWYNTTFDLQDEIVGWIDGDDQSTGEYVIDEDYGVDDGVYKYKRVCAIPAAPTACFTWTPSIVYVCDTVTLDASCSTDGGYPPLNYSWTIVSGNATLTGAPDTKITTMHCDGPGDVNVTLFVKNALGKNSTVWHIIEQKEKIGCILDLTTSTNRFCGQVTPNVGTGPNAPCDALSPDVNVTFLVSVSWNGKPVNHVLVAFEILWEYYIDWQECGTREVPPTGTNSCVLYRTAESDKDGIARIWWRVPMPCEYLMFGKFFAIATAKIQEVKQQDTMRFDVGYLITIVNVTTLEDAYHAYCDDIGFVAYVKNIAWLEKHVTFIATVYDDCDVPIGQYILPVDVIPGGAWCSPYLARIEIQQAIHTPQWTYAGMGKIYLSAFTALPSGCGVPYCPEKSDTFELTWP